MEDLISIGTIGLIKAVESFDSSKNSKLATYAARCIAVSYTHLEGNHIELTAPYRKE